MTTLNLVVAADADDWSIQAGTFYSIYYSRLGDYDASNYDNRSAWRFTNVTIAASSTIDAASMQLYGNGAWGASNPASKLAGEDADNPAAATSVADSDGRTRTTAEVSWTPTWATSAWNTTPSIASIIQEIVDRGGWASGNALNIFWDVAVTGWGGTQNMRQAASKYGANPAKLDIDYTAGGGAATRRYSLTTLGVG